MYSVSYFYFEVNTCRFAFWQLLNVFVVFTKSGGHFTKTDKAQNKKQSVYYNRFTGCVWGVSQNHDISLDSEIVGIEKCAEIIADIMMNNSADGVVD